MNRHDVNVLEFEVILNPLPTWPTFQLDYGSVGLSGGSSAATCLGPVIKQVKHSEAS